MASQARTKFSELLEYVEQLVEVHARIQTGQGRRHQQEAIHRAGVVLTVAAWEGYVESVLLEAFNALDLHAFAPAVGAPAWSKITFELARKEARDGAKQLNTPNAENVQRLFQQTIGFDPFPAWSWHARRRQWDSAEMRRRLNAWLKIRHGVAHGAGLPTDIEWINGDNGAPRLVLSLLKECKAFFGRVADQTDEALRLQLINQYAIANPW